MPSKKRSFRDNIMLIIKGIIMGAANKVPGVSGGIVAFVAGFYEEFIYSLQKINKKAFGLLFQRGLKSFLQYTNARFLALLLLGMLISYFSASQILDYLMRVNETRVWAVFFGMIIGSIYYILKDFKDWNIRTFLYCMMGLLVGVIISFLSPAKENTNLIFIFFCGVISVSGMALPGLSGSFILLLAGNYVLLLIDTVNTLYDVLYDILRLEFGFIHDPSRLQDLTIFAVFTLGSIVGLVSFSQILSYLLKRHHNVVIATIIGFIAGSLGVVWPWKNSVYAIDDFGEIIRSLKGDNIVAYYDRFMPDFTAYQTWITIFFIGIGILTILVLERYGSKQKK